MRLDQYVSDQRGRQTSLAAAIGCQPQLVWQWAREVRPVPLERCVAIEIATDREVMRWDLRPADWHKIWPELTGADGAPPISEPEAA